MENLDLRIKRTAPQDIPAVLGLMGEFAEYTNLSEYFEATEENLHNVIFGENSFVKSLIAFDGETPIAYAFYYQTFSSFRGQKSVYLEDIFITARYQGKYGIGEKMLRQIAKSGKDFGAVRMDFQVLESNTRAIKFYQKHGAIIDKEERHFKFVDEAFARLAAG